MKITVLVDNNTLIGNNYLGEPGFSLLIEDVNRCILYDTGLTDVILKNAYKMKINLNKVDTIVLSHGHYDHTWGLSYLLELFDLRPYDSKIKLVAHPDIFKHRIFDGKQIGMNLSKDLLDLYFNVITSKNPVWLSERLVFLGEIQRYYNYESNKVGQIIDNGIEKDDYMLDDSALIYKAKNGIIVLPGCSHSGICNIVNYACKICNDRRIVDIIGGLHLINPEEIQLEATINFLKMHKPKHMHACHCTDLKSKIALSQVTTLEETGVGLVLEYS